MQGEDVAAIGIDFAESDGSHSCSLEAEGEATDSTEEIEDTQGLTVVQVVVALMTGSRTRSVTVTSVEERLWPTVNVAPQKCRMPPG